MTMTIPQTIYLPENPPFPNSRLPVLLIRDAESGEHIPEKIEARFTRNGWKGIWWNGIFGYHHFHATDHEVLGCARGEVTVLLGGPNGHQVTLYAGDIAILPAGTAHRNIGSTSDYVIIGAYPPGQSPDMERGDADRYEAVRARIAALPVPPTSPITGKPISDWRSKSDFD